MMFLFVAILAGLAIVLAFVMLMRRWGIPSAMGFALATLLLAGAWWAHVVGDATMPTVLAFAGALCFVQAILIRENRNADSAKS
jgi:hypothetical protein